MLADIPLIWIAVINTLGIPLTHLAIAWVSTQLPRTWFAKKQTYSGANNTEIYEKLFFVRSWKHLLPDGAPWFKGFAKSSLESTDPDYLRTFITETRRGEFSHWVQIVAICCLTIINPWPAKLIITVYALLSNMPCIINLRYTRIRMLRVLAKEKIT